MKKKQIIIGSLLVATGILVATACFFVFVGRIGGMGPSYQAKDGDSGLTKIAQPTVPLIHALEQFWNEHHSYPSPKSDAELITTLEPYLSDDAKKSLRNPAGQINPWHYSSEGKEAYSLDYKLGWDPSLFYRCKSNEGYWEFDPGDGQPAKTIQLNP
ncbi:MAG: hypothetical protein P4L99_03995 [Chthoniobacter sp.]|nr:hypothetical protein [Chthoniobacter sp.]